MSGTCWERVRKCVFRFSQVGLPTFPSRGKSSRRESMKMPGSCSAGVFHGQAEVKKLPGFSG